MRYYDCGGYPLCSREVLALPALHALPEAGEVLFGFHRTPGAGRDTFPVTAPSLLTAEEGVSTLVTAEEPETDSALAAAAAEGAPYDYVACCGPEPLMKIVAGMADAAGVFCEVSMERRMACGVGACLSCVVDTVDGKRRACVDGPVFPASEVVW